MLIEYDYGMDLDVDDGNVILFIKSYDIGSQAMNSIFSSLSEEYDSIYFIEINVDELPSNLLLEYSIKQTPTFIFLIDGNIELKIQGVITKSALQEKINHIYL